MKTSSYLIYLQCLYQTTSFERKRPGLIQNDDIICNQFFIFLCIKKIMDIRLKTKSNRLSIDKVNIAN